MNDKIINKVTQFLTKELNTNISDVSIFKNDDGSYELFDRYHIKEERNGFTVSNKHNSEVKLFSSLKNAVAWCTFEKRSKYPEARRIEFLDIIVAGLDTNIELHKKLIDRASDIEYQSVYLAKLHEDQSKKRLMVKELSRFITESKHWQTKKFSSK